MIRSIGEGTPLVEVAQRCGFCDQSHLGRAFKSELGVTPGQWYIRTKALDYCRLFSQLIGPSIRVTADIPVMVVGGYSP